MKRTSAERAVIRLLREVDRLREKVDEGERQRNNLHTIISEQADKIDALKPIGKFDSEGLADRVDACIETRDKIVGRPFDPAAYVHAPNRKVAAFDDVTA